MRYMYDHPERFTPGKDERQQTQSGSAANRSQPIRSDTNRTPPAAGSDQHRPEQPVVPQGFKTSLLDILACPENLTPLHLATEREIDSVRDRIHQGTLRYWSGTTVTDSFDGLLIRVDGKIAYMIQRGVPIMLIDKAVILDDTVGKPAPEAHRKK